MKRFTHSPNTIVKTGSLLVLSSMLLNACGSLEHESKSQSWEQCRTSAQNMLKKRKKGQALTLAQDAVNAAQSFGDSDFRYGVALCVLGDMFNANQKVSEARSAYKKSIKVLNRAEKAASSGMKDEAPLKRSPDTKPIDKSELAKQTQQRVDLRLIREDLANSFDHLGDLYDAEGNSADAAKSYEKAAEKFELVVNSDLSESKTPELIVYQQYVRCLLALARAATNSNNTTLADSALNRAVLAAATSNCNESDRKEIRDDYLKYLQQAGRSAEARGLLADVMFDQLTADGTLSMYESDFTTAEISYRKALEEAAKSVYPDQRILKALFNLTTVFVRADKPDEVIRCGELADRYMQRTRNASRREYDQIQEVLANYYLQALNPPLCIKALMRQMHYKTVKFGRYSREVCTIYGMLGQAELIARNKAEAERYAKEGMEILKNNPIDRSFYDPMNKLSTLLMGLGHYEEARSIDQQLIDMKAKRLEPGDPWLISLKCKMVVLEQRFNHKERAANLIHEILKSVKESTPDQQAGSFPYVVLLFSLCVNSQWWDLAEEVAPLGSSILHETLGNNFPNNTTQETWIREVAKFEKQTGHKVT